MSVHADRSAPATFDYCCPVPGCRWQSKAWPEEHMAVERGMQHALEHETGVPAPELLEFEQQVGFVRTGTTGVLATQLELEDGA